VPKWPQNEKKTASKPVLWLFRPFALNEWA
jgi:hypothetical protein